jgi:hypothetical protein
MLPPYFKAFAREYPEILNAIVPEIPVLVDVEQMAVSAMQMTVVMAMAPFVA